MLGIKWLRVIAKAKCVLFLKYRRSTDEQHVPDLELKDETCARFLLSINNVNALHNVFSNESLIM